MRGGAASHAALVWKCGVCVCVRKRVPLYSNRICGFWIILFTDGRAFLGVGKSYACGRVFSRGKRVGKFWSFFANLRVVLKNYVSSIILLIYRCRIFNRVCN